MGMHDRRRDLTLEHLVDGARVSERVQLVRADVDARVANRVKAYVRDAGVGARAIGRGKVRQCWRKGEGRGYIFYVKMGVSVTQAARPVPNGSIRTRMTTTRCRQALMAPSSKP